MADIVRDDRLQAIIAATLKRQGLRPPKNKRRKGKKYWITKQEAQIMQRDRFMKRVRNIFPKE